MHYVLYALFPPLSRALRNIFYFLLVISGMLFYALSYSPKLFSQFFFSRDRHREIFLFFRGRCTLSCNFLPCGNYLYKGISVGRQSKGASGALGLGCFPQSRVLIHNRANPLSLLGNKTLIPPGEEKQTWYRLLLDFGGKLVPQKVKFWAWLLLKFSEFVGEFHPNHGDWGI